MLKTIPIDGDISEIPTEADVNMKDIVVVDDEE